MDGLEIKQKFKVSMVFNVTQALFDFISNQGEHHKKFMDMYIINDVRRYKAWYDTNFKIVLSWKEYHL